jgi:uncharacterized protein
LSIERLCISCRLYYPRQLLIRIQVSQDKQLWRVLWPKELHVHAVGRSAYICHTASCLQQVLKSKKLAKALKCGIPSDIVEILNKKAAIAAS